MSPKQRMKQVQTSTMKRQISVLKGSTCTQKYSSTNEVTLFITSGRYSSVSFFSAFQIRQQEYAAQPVMKKQSPKMMYCLDRGGSTWCTPRMWWWGPVGRHSCQILSSSPRIYYIHFPLFASSIRTGIRVTLFQFELITMMNFVRFLFIIEKITILIIVFTFIPIALYVYRPQQITVPANLQKKYASIVQQVQMNGFLVSLKNITLCQPPASTLFYQSCLNRCVIGSNCMLISSDQNCRLPNNYISNSLKICTQEPVTNQIDIGSSSFSLNTSNLPIAKIGTINDTAVSVQYYCLRDVSACSSVIGYFGGQLSSRYQQNFLQVEAASYYLMYYGLIPLVGHILIVMFLDLWFKFNLRLTNSLLIVHEALVGIGLIVNGFEFNEQNDYLTKKYGAITSSCLIKDNAYCYNNFYREFQGFQANDNISSGFNTAMSFMLVLQVLCLVVIVIINILMARYYKFREIEQSSSSYELHEV